MCKCDGGEVLAETKLIDPTKMDGAPNPNTLTLTLTLTPSP